MTVKYLFAKVIWIFQMTRNITLQQDYCMYCTGHPDIHDDICVASLDYSLCQPELTQQMSIAARITLGGCTPVHV